jgi:hydrogenase nickel incorporation protein HypA/HybF
MHEFAVVEQLLRMLEESADENDIEHIEQVRIIVGLGSTFVPDVIEFLFESMATEPPFSEATELIVETEPVKVYCPDCDEQFVHDDWRWKCPQCGCTDLEQLSGDNIYIDSYEGVQA